MSFVLGRLKPISESPACRFGLIMRHVDSDGGVAARGRVGGPRTRSLPVLRAAKPRDLRSWIDLVY
jgi:hypothetical protein